MWHYCIWSRQSRIFEAAPFFDILMQKNWQQRAINHDKYFRQDRFYFLCLGDAKTSILKQWVDFPKRVRIFTYSGVP